MTERRAVVVGAGINGLVAAHYLRRAGLEVTLLERADRVGGACIASDVTVAGRTQSYSLGASVLRWPPWEAVPESGSRTHFR